MWTASSRSNRGWIWGAVALYFWKQKIFLLKWRFGEFWMVITVLLNFGIPLRNALWWKGRKHNYSPRGDAPVRMLTDKFRQSCAGLNVHRADEKTHVVKSRLEEVRTHKSAKTHTGNVFCDWWPWPFDRLTPKYIVSRTHRGTCYKSRLATFIHSGSIDEQ